MKGPRIPTHGGQAAPPASATDGPGRQRQLGQSWHRLTPHTPAMAGAWPVLALGHGVTGGAAVAVALAAVAGHVLATAARAAVREWFWWRARGQGARDLRQLLRLTGSAQEADHLAQRLAARHQAVVDAYVRAHSTTGVPRPPRRPSPRPDDVPRRSR